MAERTTIALSGVVGAGKSSAAKAIVQGLRAAGCAAEHVRFQDLAQPSRRTRRGTPETPVSHGVATAAEAGGERWSGYRRRPLTALVAGGYAMRTLLFRSRLRRWPKETVLVFDRYFYDNLVHFDLGRAGMPLTLLTKAIPTPTIAALLLVREATIRARRARYSAEYARQVAAGYEELPDRFPDLLVVRTDSFASVDALVRRIVVNVLARRNDGKMRVKR